ncbi:MAG: hypothetical protein LBJ98_02870, partial [Endomicrobium sp.]|nr:hypothetical protein [Endomicrobium sp.]
KEAREKNNKEYSKTKLNVQNAIDEHAKEHPVEAFFEDIAGSVPAAIAMPGGAIARGASFGKKVFHGAKLGGAWGAARGLGENLNAEKGLAETIKNALISGGFGAGAGAGLSAIVAPFITSKYAKLENAIGKNRIKEAVKTGTPLLEDAGEKIMKFAQGVRTRGNTKALQRFTNYENKLEKGQKSKINKIIDENISNKNYEEELSRIEKEGEAIYKPLYAEAEKVGEIPRPRTQNSQVIGKYFKKAREFSDDLRGLPDNNIRVLQKVKEKIDNNISKHYKFGEESDARDLEILRKKLVEDIDDSVLAHAPAREAYAKTKRQAEAINRGYKDVPKAKLEDLSSIKNIEGLIEDEQRELGKIGAAQYFRNKNFNAPKNNANLFTNVFADDDLERMVKTKILNPDQAERLKSAAYKGEKSISNIHKLTSGSQTAEKLNNPFRWLLSPKRSILKGTDKAIEWLGKGGDSRSAKYLTDPKALKYAYQHDKDKNVRYLLKDMILKMLGEQKGKRKQEEIE